MPERLLTLNEAKVRRLHVNHELRHLGYSRSFVEQLYQRLVRHDQARRARAVVQALAGYRPAQSATEPHSAESVPS